MKLPMFTGFCMASSVYAAREKTNRVGEGHDREACRRVCGRVNDHPTTFRARAIP